MRTIALAAMIIATAGLTPCGYDCRTVGGGGLEAAAQVADLSGTWKLDESHSRFTQAVALVGLVKTGAPATLHITHAANGTVIVESQINESQSRLYKPGVQTATPVVPNGTITMTSKWDGRTLVSEGAFESTGARVSVTERLALGADGQTLTIGVTSIGPGPDEKRETSLVYTRTTSVGLCQTWPTPCKY